MNNGNKSSILTVAAKHFADKGFVAASVKEIVTEAGVNISAVAYHFGSKEGLFTAVFVKKIEPLRQLAIKLMQSNKTCTEKIRELFQIYAVYFLCTEPSLRVIYADMLSGHFRLPKEATMMVEWRNKIFIDTFKRGIKNGELRKCDLETAAWCFFGMLMPYILYEPIGGAGGKLKPYPREFVNRIINSALDIYFNGIAGKSPKSGKDR